MPRPSSSPSAERPPKYIYLGLQEWNELRSYLSLTHGIELRPCTDQRPIHDAATEGPTCKIGDSEVLYVAKLSHLGVGS